MAKISAPSLKGEPSETNGPVDLEEIRESDRLLAFYEFEDESYTVSPNVSANDYDRETVGEADPSEE